MRPIVLVLKTLIQPPLSLFLLGFTGWILARWRPRLGRSLMLTAVIVAYLLCTPAVSGYLSWRLQTAPPLTPIRLDETAGAIVILSGSIYLEAPEYGGDTVGASTLVRLRYGAALFHKLGLPILVTGGVPSSASKSLAVTMQETLQHSFHTPTRWIETASRTTYENAKFSAEILRQAQVHTIYLVTHALHMPRAQAAFEAFGLRVIPAPTDFAVKPVLRARDFIPRASDFRDSYFVVHEWIGRIWYALRFRFTPAASAE